MSFPFNIYFGALLCAAVTSALAFPFWKRWCEWSGHLDDPGHRKIHSAAVPLAGGLTVMSGFFGPMLAGGVLLYAWNNPLLDATLRELLQYGLSKRALQVGAILLGAFGMVLLGWWDDRYELSPLPKFAGQILFALLVAWSGIRITLFVPSEIVNYFLTILWILALTNAFNFLDNMNGLCSGLGIIASWSCAWAAALQGQYLVALLGFFPFNFPHAQAFLGDAGSHLVGFLISILAILPNFYSRKAAHPIAVLAPLLLLALPLYDLVTVVWIRWKLRRPFWLGDNNHISHRLVRRGFTRTHAVLLILLAQAAACAAAISFLARAARP